eukprot:g47311.t1
MEARELREVIGGILRDRICMCLEKQELVEDSHPGFLHGKWCLINLIEFFEEVVKRIDEGRAVDMIYLDFIRNQDDARFLAQEFYLKLQAFGALPLHLTKGQCSES